jgi:hypothetical protein
MTEKVDNRGAHWQDKVKSGTAGEPWKNNTIWAVKRTDVQKEFFALVASKGLPQPFLPWEKQGHRAVGNRNKTLWMHLVKCSLEGLVEIEMDNTFSAGFMGITAVRVLKRDEFNAGMFPTVSGQKGEYKIKTLTKYWAEAGFVEDKHGMRFDKDTFKRMQDQAQRALDKRRTKSDTAQQTPVQPVVVLPVQPAVALPVQPAVPTAQVPVVPAVPVVPVVAPTNHFFDALLQAASADMQRQAAVRQAAISRVQRANQAVADALNEVREAYAALGALNGV